MEHIVHNHVTKHFLMLDGKPLSFAQVVDLWQLDSLWRTVGSTMKSTLGTKPVWLNTAGGGVAWLHVRLDSHPKYYSYAPYRVSR